ADAQQALQLLVQRVATHRLAGLGPAQLEDVAAGRLSAEVVVEGDDAVDLRRRQVERPGDHLQRFLRHVAELLLHPVQYRRQRPFEVLPSIDDGGGPRRETATLLLHRHAAPSLRSASRASPGMDSRKHSKSKEFNRAPLGATPFPILSPYCWRQQ